MIAKTPSHQSAAAAVSSDADDDNDRYRSSVVEVNQIDQQRPMSAQPSPAPVLTKQADREVLTHRTEIEGRATQQKAKVHIRILDLLVSARDRGGLRSSVDDFGSFSCRARS